ncbi:MAG: NUDIX hydrolase [Bacteroidales bacterium]
MSEIKHFNIRVYALIINEKQEILISDEFMLNRRMTKFPGGGLKFGEGTIDCLKREALEEFGQEIETDFFQKALFYEDHQLISIYYTARLLEPPRFKISNKPFDFPEDINGSISFRLEQISDLHPGVLSFPIDRKVIEMLKEERIKKK